MMAQLYAMKFLFHLMKGSNFEETAHGENLHFATEMARQYGGLAEEVILTYRDNCGESDPPYATRFCEETAVVVETSLDGLAQLAADRPDLIIQLVASSRWEDS